MPPYSDNNKLSRFLQSFLNSVPEETRRAVAHKMSVFEQDLPDMRSYWIFGSPSVTDEMRRVGAMVLEDLEGSACREERAEAVYIAMSRLADQGD
jgi:hypothetical protein